MSGVEIIIVVIMAYGIGAAIVAKRSGPGRVERKRRKKERKRRLEQEQEEKEAKEGYEKETVVYKESNKKGSSLTTPLLVSNVTKY